MIPTALIGYGMAGRVFHAPVISCVPGLRLASVVERSRRESAERYPDVKVVASAEDVFADPDIRLVVVATPNPTHAPLARAALEAGKHVVVDKPMATSAEDARALVAIARERGLTLAVFQNRRWDGDFMTVRRVVEGGLLGRLVSVESRFDRYRPEPKPGAWRERDEPGSGVLFDLGPHLLDQALALFGSPLRVTGEARREREHAAVDDAFDMTLEYAGGLRVRLGATMLARTPGPRFRLRGTLGTFEKGGLDPQEDALKAGRTPDEPGWGADAESRWGAVDTEVGGVRVTGRIETLPGDYRGFYENVRDAIESGAPLAVPPEQVAEALGILEAIRDQ